MTVLKLFFCSVLAIFISPLSIFLMLGFDKAVWVNLALFVAGHLTFWLLFAAPGLLLLLATLSHGLLVLFYRSIQSEKMGWK